MQEVLLVVMVSYGGAILYLQTRSKLNALEVFFSLSETQLYRLFYKIGTLSAVISSESLIHLQK